MLENNKREIKLRSSFSGSSKAWAQIISSGLNLWEVVVENMTRVSDD